MSDPPILWSSQPRESEPPMPNLPIPNPHPLREHVSMPPGTEEPANEQGLELPRRPLQSEELTDEQRHELPRRPTQEEPANKQGLELPRRQMQVEGPTNEQHQQLWPRQKFKDPSWMTKNAGKRVHLIAPWEVENSTEPVTSSGGYEFLCSYSWKQTAKPTIYVPGTPPQWTPPSLPKMLDQDSGFYWCDQHAHRVPRHQFEPVFQALAVMNPTAQFNNVDIVVNRNSLRKFLAFVSFNRGEGQFHVDLTMVHNTLFIGRKEAKAKPQNKRGYGHNFESEFTTDDPELPEAEGHHRVVRYKFGGLNMVVRIEADGYCTYADDDDGDDSPNEFFRNVLGTTKQTSIVHSSPFATATIAKGKLVPQNNILELKTASNKSSSLEQLWFGRTPFFCCAKRPPSQKGLIVAVDVERVRQKMFEEWEKANQTQLLRLAWFLAELRRVTMEKTSKGAAVLVQTEKGAPLQIYEAKASCFGALPGAVIERFWG
jgi:hypothetical protein